MELKPIGGAAIGLVICMVEVKVLVIVVVVVTPDVFVIVEGRYVCGVGMVSTNTDVSVESAINLGSSVIWG